MGAGDSGSVGLSVDERLGSQPERRNGDHDEPGAVVLQLRRIGEWSTGARLGTKIVTLVLNIMIVRVQRVNYGDRSGDEACDSSCDYHDCRFD